MKRVSLTLTVLVTAVAFGTACGSSSSPATPNDTDTTTDNELTDNPDTENPADTDLDTETTESDTEKVDKPKACDDDSSCSSGKACSPDTRECKATECGDASECTGTDKEFICGAGPIGKGLCLAKSCTENSQCKAGFSCSGGACVKTDPANNQVTSVVISSPSLVTKKDLNLQLTAVALNKNGGVVSGATFAWTTDKASAGAIDAATGKVTGGADSGAFKITATVTGGTASANVTLRNFGAVDTGKIRVVVYDIDTKAFIEGATVLVNDKSGTTGTGDNAGVAIIDAPAAGDVDVSVFAANHVWFSAFGLDSTQNDVVVPLNPAEDNTKIAGFNGHADFSGIPAALTKEIKVAIVGPAIFGNLFDISLTSLLGDSLKRHIKLGTIVDQDVALPGGINLAISNSDFMPDGFYGFAGTRTETVAWVLGGYLPLNDVITIVSNNLGGGSSASDILKNVGPILAQVLPLLENFYHGNEVVTGLTVAAKIPDVDDINGNDNKTELVFDKTKLKKLEGDSTLKLKQSLNASTTLKFGGFDKLFAPGSTGAGAIVLAATNVTGQGFVPLGLTVALDQDDKGKTDGKIDDTVLHFASQHDGVEGYPYYFLTLGADINSIVDSKTGPGVQLSGIIKRGEAGKGYASSYTFDSFPGFPTKQTDVAAKKYRLDGATNNPSQIHRFVLSGSKNKWQVYVKGGAQFTLPDVPAAFDYNDVKPADDGDTTINAISLKGGLSYNDLLKFNDTNLDQLNDLTEGFVLWIPSAPK